MKNEADSGNIILDRSVAYSLEVIKLYRELTKDAVGRLLAGQLMRAGTSIGANVHEAQGGQSRADFIAKMSIAYKEARECSYWRRLIGESGIAPSMRLGGLIDETGQIVRILSSILVSAKRGSVH